MPEPTPKRYRLQVRYRQWIDHPESPFSYYYVGSDDPSWLNQEGVRLERRGHRVIKFQRLDGDHYNTI
jgi:hypothetical protein